MKKIISFLLILSLLLPCLIACSKKDEESKERSEPVVLDSDSELVNYISNYILESLRPTSCHIPDSDCGKLILIKYNNYASLVDFRNSKRYFVCAYHQSNHMHKPENYCNYKGYTWVMYENASDITDSFMGNEFFCAFQINVTSTFEEITSSGKNATSFEYCQPYEPAFINGKNILKPVRFDQSFVYLGSYDEGKVCYLGEKYEEDNLMRCSYSDGQYYVKIEESTLYRDGRFLEKQLSSEFGKYYDALISVMRKKECELGEDCIKINGLISIDDLLKIVI